MCTGKINCPGERERIAKYSDTHSNYETAKHFGVAESSVRRYRDQFGKPKKRTQTLKRQNNKVLVELVNKQNSLILQALDLLQEAVRMSEERDFDKIKMIA